MTTPHWWLRHLQNYVIHSITHLYPLLEGLDVKSFTFTTDLASEGAFQPHSYMVVRFGRKDDGLIFAARYQNELLPMVQRFKGHQLQVYIQEADTQTWSVHIEFVPASQIDHGQEPE